MKAWWVAYVAGVMACISSFGAPRGFLEIHEQKKFPIGCYELPRDSAELHKMRETGFNLVHCGNRLDLDRVAEAGMRGWISLPLDSGDTNQLRQQVRDIMDHPALVAWEGPDEIVWNFTAFSGLYRAGIYNRPGEWWLQTPFAVHRAENEAGEILPRLRAGCEMVRNLDRNRHPIWINEAAESDMKFIRQYLDSVDITGCDTYPVHETNRNPSAVADFTSRFKSIARGKPVWMVLQGFSWHEIQPPKDQNLVYPSFLESRLMAYEAISHGASGILYWGTWMPPRSSFRESLFALVSELNALQSFLVADDEPGVHLSLTESNGRFSESDRGVKVIARRSRTEWVIILVNEDNHSHMGVEVLGLKKLEGKGLMLLYDTEVSTVSHGSFITRLRPHEVKVFATSRRWETTLRAGRNFE